MPLVPLLTRSQLVLKERVLSEKAIELDNLGLELERKRVLQEQSAAAERAAWELERSRVRDSCPLGCFHSPVRVLTLTLLRLLS